MKSCAAPSAVLMLSLLCACAASPPPAAVPRAATVAAPGPAPASTPQALTFRSVSEDTTLKTPGGAPVIVHGGWRVAELDGCYVLEEGEQGLRVTLLEVPGASAAQAIDAAWRRVAPGFARPVRQESKPPPRDGWDELVQRVYEVPASEARSVTALSLRAGGVSYVSLIDGTLAALDRRGAQVTRTIRSFKPPTLAEESFAGRKARTLSAAQLEAFAQELDAMRQQVGIPGAAVAVVQGDRVVLERGFGVRELGRTEPVTPDTLFLIGSMTKSLTSLLMAQLVDAGKLRWDTPVTQLMPSFAVADAEVTRRLTLEQTVCACTGMPRQDLEWLFEYADATGEQRIAQLREMKPTTRVGETFQYSNPMVTAGGYMAAHVYAPRLPLGRAYDRAMQTQVFDPLGMRATTFDFARALRSPHATPHGASVSGEFAPLPLEVEHALVSVRPAGGAWSNVRDMARYLQLELGKGRLPGGTAVVSEASLMHRRRPQVRISDRAHYGLGLIVVDERGQQLVQHNGNTLGMSSALYFFPEHGVGLVLLTNVQGDGPLRNAVYRRFVELLFDGKERAQTGLAYALAQKRESISVRLSELSAQPDLAWLGTLAGVYQHAGLGTVSLRVGTGGAVLDAGEWRSAVGVRTAKDGARTVILLDAPLPGIELRPESHEGRTRLVIEDPQMRYVLEPVGTPSVTQH